MVKLKLNNQTVRIDAGELVGYEIDGHEIIHQKGSPGWRNSDTEMFPIIGPTADAGFMVQTPRDLAVQDQHGLLRELKYELVDSSDIHAEFHKTYKERTPVVNSKFPEKSTRQYLFYTYSFNFVKKYRLLPEGLEITFTIAGERDTPFMLGYHPAFKIYTKDATVEANGKAITLNDIISVGSRALQVPNCTEIVLSDQKAVRIETEGFDNFMLWTEVENMVCIEPITFYPYAVEQKNLHEGFQFLKDKDEVFKVLITPID
ncbi:MAG: aldose epimerase [Pseudozobellia sp.]|nr:aldose epimerase [Pseudozobellia sp.]MBG50774.1 aldose epimerase [Pseudozobellia sp.]|tara:strand:- start:2338 stop:3117 length:780 start_codon:yes stop_codon:yes gene_type:complete